MTLATTAWSTAPQRPARAEDHHRGDALMAWLIVAAGPSGWLAGAGQRWPVLALCAALAVTATRSRWSTSHATQLAIAAVTAVTLTAATEARAGWWAAANLLWTCWLLAPATTRNGARRRFPQPPRQAALAATALSMVAGWFGWRGHLGWPVLLPALAVFAVPVVVTALGPKATAAIDRFAHAVGHLVTRASFGLLSLPMVLVPHTWGRICGDDGFDSTGRWARPPRRSSPTDATWSNDRPSRTSTIRRRLATAALLTAAALAAWALLTRTTAPPPNPGFTLTAPTALDGAPPDPAIDLQYPAPPGVTESTLPAGAMPAALADSPWWSTTEFQDAQDYALDIQAVWRFENPFRFLDVTSEYINVVDGVRASWTPPPCDCRRLTVWMYGGSTTWGISQRDDHTIASELARVAHDDGITIDVQNRGITGFTHWMESERLAWDLATQPHPDLVIFYDGVNEIYSGNGGNDIRATFEAPVDAATFDLWRGARRSDGPAPTPPPGGRVLDTSNDPLGPALRAREITERYRSSLGMSRAITAATGLPARYFWQPSRYDRPLIPEEQRWSTSQENDMRLVMQVAAADLPADVSNLREVLVADRTPLFTDDVHHNERGARLIAEALYRELEPDLRGLSGSGGAPGSTQGG